MRGYLLDSSVLISILRGKNEAMDLYQHLNEDLYTSSICLAEIYEGVYRSTNTKKNKEKLLKLISALKEIIPFTQKEAEIFGLLKVKIKHKPIPDFDLQIASTCIANNLTLVTFDKRHFGNITGLEIYG